MIDVNIKQLQELLQHAADAGCERVKLQLYDSWEDVVREQKSPTLPKEEYCFDARFYNTVEFRTQIVNEEATDKIMVQSQGKLLILHVEISDFETLVNGFGLQEQ